MQIELLRAVVYNDLHRPGHISTSFVELFNLFGSLLEGLALDLQDRLHQTLRCGSKLVHQHRHAQIPMYHSHHHLIRHKRHDGHGLSEGQRLVHTVHPPVRHEAEDRRVRQDGPLRRELRHQHRGRHVGLRRYLAGPEHRKGAEAKGVAEQLRVSPAGEHLFRLSDLICLGAHRP